jgi:hypothetical protein
MRCEIALVMLLPRNDITTQSRWGEEEEARPVTTMLKGLTGTEKYSNFMGGA